ncbi:polymeric immunoglobulin receptor-like [Micropterus salmoides]|uniref:polymeric immunoglobulin receptor-like n=1 Tax=Micropterus salmoides TaxID=27706 RepID=UPI0018EA3694|nr:polymeric immunoglobulin receptor-like [Micropterus salmoides]
MKVHHILICFFLSLQDGNTGLTNAQMTPVYTGTEGGDIRVTCPFSSYGRSMFFCKRECKPEDILIHTTGVRDQRGRYSITYEGGGFFFVSITQLTKSDSGRYRCGLGELITELEIIVVDALLDGNPFKEKPLYTRAGGNIVVGCSFIFCGSRKYFCKEECGEKDILVETTGFTAERGRYSIKNMGQMMYVSITQLIKSDSGRYRCGLEQCVPPDSYREFEIIVKDDALVYAVPIFVIIAIILGLTLRICIQRKTKTEGLQTSENSDRANMELAPYENSPPVSTSESTYESLDPASRDQNQTYATLTHTHTT